MKDFWHDPQESPTQPRVHKPVSLWLWNKSVHKSNSVPQTQPPPPPDFFSPLAQLLFLKSRYSQMLISVLSSSLFPSCPSLLHHLLRSLPFSLFPSPPFPLFFLRLQSAMISSVRRPPRQLSWSHLLVMSSPGLELSHPSGLFCILFVWGFFVRLYIIFTFLCLLCIPHNNKK